MEDDELGLDDETIAGIIRLLMRIDERLERLLGDYEEDDDEEA